VLGAATQKTAISRNRSFGVCYIDSFMPHLINSSGDHCNELMQKKKLQKAWTGSSG
jgi:hypothetical protein